MTTLVANHSVSEREWAEIVDRLSRRRFLGIGAGVVATVALAGCSTAESTPAAETVSYGWGDFTGQVPKDPQRVVVLDGRVDLEFAMMMGYPVVGSGNSWFPNQPIGFQFPGRTVAGARAVNNTGSYTINYEALLDLEPDLIVMTQIGYSSDWYGNERLAAIAPLLVVGDDVPRAGGGPVDWRGALTGQSSQLGRTRETEVAVAGYDDRLGQLLPFLQERLGSRKIALCVYTESGVLVHQRTLTTSVGIDAGLDLAFRDDHNADNSIELSLEQLDRLSDVDLIIVQSVKAGAVPPTSVSPTWLRLPAVQAGKVITTDARYNQGFALTATIFLDVLEQGARMF